MGLIGKFQDFRKSRDDKRIAKLSAVVKNSKAIKEDRWNAIQFFKEHKDIEVAIANMLPRFEYSLEHGIQDTREKEACMDAITQFGADALTFIEDHLIKTTRIAWPIKILKALGKDSEVVDTLKKALDFGDVRFEQQKVDKNYDILCYLVDYKLPEFAEKLVHFLNDPDERVRYACCEVLIEQEGDFVPEILEKYLSDQSAENTRIKQSVIDAFIERGWMVKDLKAFENRQVSDSVVIDKSGKLKKS